MRVVARCASGTSTSNVVRITDAETIYEDSVEHRCESEREVTGLVFALVAAFLEHDAAALDDAYRRITEI